MATFHHHCVHTFTIKCSRCHHIWTTTRQDDYTKNSKWLKFVNEGKCEKGIKNGHIDCIRGCTHPSIYQIILRIIVLPIYFRPIIGYGEIIKDEKSPETSYAVMPGARAEDIFNAQARGLRGDIKILK